MHHLGVSLFLNFGSGSVCNFLLLDGTHHLPLFLFELFALLDTLNFPLFDLLDDDRSTTALGLSSELFTLILCLEGLQALDFHHDIETFLFSEPFTLQLLVFFELFVPDGHDFGVKGHLIHKFHVIMFLIHRCLGSGEQSFSALILLDFDLSERQFACSSLILFLHPLLAGFGELLLLLLLFLSNFVILLDLIGTNNHSALFDASDVSCGQDSSSAGPTFATFRLNITSQLSELIVTNICTVLVRRLCCRCYQKNNSTNL